MFKRQPLLTFIIIIVLAQILLGGQRLQLFLQEPLYFIVLIASVLLALVIHEFFHALTADFLGDPNPRLSGRVSLNPKNHLDPLGTLLIIFTGFGWGKPVAFDPYNLKDPVKDGALIAAAGPLSNFLLTVIFGLFLRLFPATLSPAVLELLFIFFNINLSLAVFNLLPFFPLDGHHILRVFLTKKVRLAYDRFNQNFGIFLAFFLILPIFGQAPVTVIMTPVLNFFYKIFLGF